MAEPVVSIILPTYNGSMYIARAIESVISQDFLSWELLVIDDGSTDDTKDIVRPYSHRDNRIRLIENDGNLGIQKTLNKGIMHAKGKYIARIDDDDLWNDREKLAQQVVFLDSHKEYVLIGTDATVVNENEVKLSYNTMPKGDKAIRNRLLRKNCFLHPTVMMRKNVLDKVGGYSESPRTLHAEDYELWLRLGMHGKLENLPLPSTTLTARKSSITNSNRILQARHMIFAVWRYRNNYPYALRGLVVTALRYCFFSVSFFVPFPERWFYFIQRTQKQL